MSDSAEQIGFANTALFIGLATTLARKGVISLHDVAEIIEHATLELETSGLAATESGQAAYNHLSSLRLALTNSVGKHLKDR